MTAFWAFAAGLAVLALALVARPLWTRGSGNLLRGPRATRDTLNVSVYRDQLRELEADLRAGTLARLDYERARADLERRLLEDVESGAPPAAAAPQGSRARWAVASLACAIPVLALGVYLAVGDLRALDPGQREAPPIGRQQIEAMVQQLADRLAQNPENIEGWKMLGRSYGVMGRFADAVSAYSKAVALAPRDPQLLADFADSLAMARGQSMQGEPEQLALRALRLDPENLKALSLAGTAAFERKDYAGAARHWKRMLPLLEPGSEDARTVRTNLDEARALLK